MRKITAEIFQFTAREFENRDTNDGGAKRCTTANVLRFNVYTRAFENNLCIC